jgi:NAD(P)H dehydrogenase (quinone)
VRVLLVSAHPVPDSYVAAVRAAAISGLAAGGHDVDDLDLDAESFQPLLTRAEWEGHRWTGVGTRRSAPRGRLSADVAAHAARLRAADALVLVYPTWWGAPPAIMKGWLDRVWVEGVAFSFRPDGRRARHELRRIRYLVAITTHGSPKRINAVEGEPGKRLVLRQLRAACHPRVRTRWIACYGIDQSDEARRRSFLGHVERAMADLERVTGPRGRLRPAGGRRGRRSRSSRPS